MKKKKEMKKELQKMIKSLRKVAIASKEAPILAAAHELLEKQLRALKKEKQTSGKKEGVIFYDSRILPLPERIRPAAVETARVKYQIDEQRLQISLYPISSERFEVIGHLSGVPAGKILDVKLKRGRSQITTHSNEFQIFRFERVQKASYELAIFDSGNNIANVVLDL